MTNIKDIFQNQECLTVEQLKTYTQGEMHSSEQHRVESHLLDCPLCAAAIEGLETASFTNEDEKRLQKVASKNQERKTPVKPIKSNRFLLNRMAAAVLLFLIPVSLLLYWNNTQLERSYADHYEVLKYDNTMRGEGSAKGNPILNNAMQSYQQGHYEASVEQFENYFEVENENAQAKLFAGIAALEAGYFTKAEDFLSTVRINNERYFDEATWYLIMTYLKQDNKPEASQLIDELLQDKTGYYYQKASELKASIAE